MVERPIIPGKDSAIELTEEEAEAVNTAALAWQLATRRQHRALKVLRTMGTVALLAIIATSLLGDTPRVGHSGVWEQRIRSFLQGVAEEVSVLAARGTIYLHGASEGRPSGALTGFADAYMDPAGNNGECLRVETSVVTGQPVTVDTVVTIANGTTIIGSLTANNSFTRGEFLICPAVPGGHIDESAATIALRVPVQEAAATP